MDVDPVDRADIHKIAESIQCWTNEGRTGLAIIDELSLGRYWHAVSSSAPNERSNLTFDRVGSCLLFAGHTCIKRSSNGCHKNLRAEALRRTGLRSSRRFV